MPDIDAPTLAARLRAHAASVAWQNRPEIGADLIAAAEALERLDRLVAERDAEAAKYNRLRTAFVAQIGLAPETCEAVVAAEQERTTTLGEEMAAGLSKFCDDLEAGRITIPAAVAPSWSDRLEFDPNVSASSPVVKGTWVTASHIVDLIVDDWTWFDILRAHPELTEDDIRACLAYTVAEDSPRGQEIERDRVRYADDDDFGGSEPHS